MSAAKQILFFITQIFLSAVSFSQAGFCLKSSDSLKKLLSTEIKEDTIRADRLFYLSNSYIYDNPDSGIYYADSALRLSRKLGYTIREAWANYNLVRLIGYLVITLCPCNIIYRHGFIQTNEETGRSKYYEIFHRSIFTRK
jgi:hypothetical protein